MKISKKGGSQALELHDNPALGPYYRIVENCSYVVETDEELLHPAVSRIKDGVYELVFNNFVGWSHVGGELLKVVTPKLSARQFDAMLNQITEVYASLPFDFNTPTFLPFERMAPNGEGILYHAFMYLRYIVLHAEPGLESIVNRIIAAPHRVFFHENVRRQVARAKNFRPASLNRMVSCTANLLSTTSASHLQEYELASRLTDLSGNRYFPTHLECTKKNMTLDTPENRFVKYFISRCIYIAELFRRYFVRKVNKADLIDYILVDDAKKIVDILENLLSRSFFDGLGDMQHLPYTSQVLQKGDGYRELFAYFNRMNLGSTYPIGSTDLMKIIENKDIALLYEYWTFFACLDALKNLLGEPRNASLPSSGVMQSDLPWDLRVDFGEEVSLFYNKTYSHSRKESYSLAYRPDVSLETEHGIYIFDAKFKKENVIYSQFGAEETAETEDEEFSQGFKYGDISKMHCYRDAIEGVKAAFVLYPGNRYCFFHRTKGKSISVDEVDDFDGVGAVPLRPPAGSDSKFKHPSLLLDLLTKVLRNEL